MVALLRTWVLNIVSIIIFITFLEILLPSSSIKKYIKMIVGLLVMIVILNPLLELANGKVKIENEILKTSSLLDQKSLALNISQLEGEQNQQMIQYYKSKIEDSIKERIEYKNDAVVLNISSRIDEDIKSKDFGTVKELNIILTEIGESKNRPDENNIIPTVNISIGNIKKNNSSTKDYGNSHLVDDIQTNIAELYSLDKDKVHISVE